MKEQVKDKLYELFSLEGKVILMTGAAGAIGRVLAKGMAQAGGTMMLCDREKDGLEELRKEILQEGGKGETYVLDVTDLANIEETTEKIIREYGQIDVLVNLAGINKRVALLEGDEETFDRIIDVHLKGTYFMSQAVAKHMKEKQKGSIINVTSYNAVMMLGGNGVYGASKSGVAALTRSQAIEWAKYGIRSNALSPGHISTRLTAQLWEDPMRSKYMLDRIAMARPGKPEDLLGMTILLASDASAYMSGMMYHVDGGCLAGGQPWEIKG